MQEDQEYEEEYEEGHWEDHEDQQEPWTWTEQEEDKGTSSKESSCILIDSTKDSPKDKSSTTQGKVATGTSPKPKEANKELTSEDFTMKTFQMLMENHRQTLEVLIGSNKGTLTEDEKLDQEDQRIKEMNLESLKR